MGFASPTHAYPWLLIDSALLKSWARKISGGWYTVLESNLAPNPLTEPALLTSTLFCFVLFLFTTRERAMPTLHFSPSLGPWSRPHSLTSWFSALITPSCH